MKLNIEQYDEDDELIEIMVIILGLKERKKYNSRTVFLKRKERRSKASVRYCRINIWSKVEKYILEKIKEYYSPKQISWRWTIENNSALSKDTILQLYI